MITGVIITLAALYAAGGLFWGFVAYILEDPYNHFSKARDLKWAIFYGTFWLPVLIYFFCTWFYYQFIWTDPK